VCAAGLSTARTQVVRASGSCGVAPLPEPPLGRWPGSRNASSSWIISLRGRPPGWLLDAGSGAMCGPSGEDSTLAVGPGRPPRDDELRTEHDPVASDWTVALMPFLSLYQRGGPSVSLTAEAASKIRFTTISILFFSHRSPWRKEQGAPAGALVTVTVWVASCKYPVVMNTRGGGRRTSLGVFPRVSLGRRWEACPHVTISIAPARGHLPSGDPARP
jgi:hypothetical protein